ncbi:hypothetical protein [Devosia sp.]|uniref:hypothetical protein n=1 Tax=Devosia sp. TaxID=1871048 RepID=UPI00263102F2|nr:hypothetical protein [Devosia sp.]
MADRIAAIQEQRRPRRAGGAVSPVIGFHFKCQSDYEVTLLPDGRFWSGVWAVDEDLCQPAIQLGGYVALHSAKREKSYRQGTLIDWKTEARTKGKTAMGVSFLLKPFDEPLVWFGNGSGERGYRRVDDKPTWVPQPS